jgi:hypothetical protein
MTSNDGQRLDWILALVAVLIVFFAPRDTAGFGLIALLLLCLAMLGMWVRHRRFKCASSDLNETGVGSRSGPSGSSQASGWRLVLGALVLLLWVVLSQVCLLNVEDSFVWLIVSLNLPFGLAVLALIQLWRQARGQGTPGRPARLHSSSAAVHT